MALSNYEIMRNRMRGEFTGYDQQKMIRKFHLEHDDEYLYIPFTGRPYRVGRHTGIVEWSADGFRTAVEADYNESMTIYDVLCCSKDDCHLSGHFCPSNMLKGTVRGFNNSGNFFQKAADGFSGRLPALQYACARLGTPANLSGDVSAVLYPFSFLPVTLQYWEADEEFPASLKFMFDENVQDFMHFETTYFMVSHVVSRIQALMQEYEGVTE